MNTCDLVISSCVRDKPDLNFINESLMLLQRLLSGRYEGKSHQNGKEEVLNEVKNISVFVNGAGLCE